MDWLEEYKRRLYLVMLCSGLLASSFGWAINEYTGSISWFTRGIFATVLSVATVLIVLILTHRVPVRIVQEALFLIIGGVLLSVMAYGVYGDMDAELQASSLFSLYLFLPFLYIFIFLAYDEHGALARSAVIFCASVGITLPALLYESYHSLIVMPNTILISYLAAALIIGHLYMLNRMKTSLVDAEELTRTDPLTSVLNRRGFDEVLDDRIEEALKDNTPLSMIVFDLDDFKRLNDSLGHDIGDEALVSVAKAVELELRESDSMARRGGEEFAILCPETNSDDAYLLAERLRATVEHCNLSMDWRLTASFGVSNLSLGASKEDLAKRADLALYIAKGEGKNCTRIYGTGATTESFS